MGKPEILQSYATARTNVLGWLNEQDKLFAALAGIDPPAIDTGGRSITPPAKIQLPRESDQMRDFYGEPGPDPSYLAWFNFPVADMVLYSRDGAAMSDHTADGLDDHRMHKFLVELIQDALKTLFEVLGKDEFYRQGWFVYGGCHNYRTKSLGSSLSVHAWGAAIDMNPVENPYYAKATTFSETAVSIMESFGFLWGPKAWGMPGYDNPNNKGLFIDPMHFQAAIPYIRPESFYGIHGLPKNVEPWG